MQVVLKDVQTGSKAAVSDILSEEGQQLGAGFAV